MWFEVFASGEQIDSNGNRSVYTNNFLDKVADDYNSAIESDQSAKVPAVIGHPKNDDPAIGWVRKLGRRGNKLVADIDFTDKEFLENLNNQFKNVSISLSGSKIKHIGFLGAVAPAVKNLKQLEDFSEFDNFENSSLKAENEELKSKLKLMEKDHRITEFRAYANSLMEMKKSSIKPSQVNDIIDLLEISFEKDLENNYFNEANENSYLSKLKNLIEGKNSFNLTEEIYNANIPLSNFNQPKENLNEKRLELHNRAKSMQQNDPMLSYEEAILKATQFFNNL